MPENLLLATVLDHLRPAFSPNSSFTDSLVKSLFETQLRVAKRGNEFDSNNAAVFPFEVNLPESFNAAVTLFQYRIKSLKKEGPVAVLDIPNLGKQLGHKPDLEEISRYTWQAIGRDNGSIDLLPSALTKSNFGLAIIYGDSQPAGSKNNRWLDNFIMGQSNRDRLAILISSADLHRVNDQFASPWPPKLNFSQLLKLREENIRHLVGLLAKTVAPERKNIVAMMIPTGSGKTSLLNHLGQQGIAGVGIIDGLKPFEPQKNQALKNQVIFVDEAIAFDRDTLLGLLGHAVNENKRLILFYHDQVEVKSSGQGAIVSLYHQNTVEIF